MGVSLYYSATRDTPLTDTERARALEILGEGEQALMEEGARMMPEWHRDGEVPGSYSEPGEIFEPLALYRSGSEPGELLAGSSKLPPHDCGEAPLFSQLHHYLAALSRLRAVFPDAGWTVGVEDAEVPWVDGRYAFG